MFDSLWRHGLQPARLLCPWDSPGKNTGVGCHSLLQGIFPTQRSNLSLLNYRQILYHLSHQESCSQTWLRLWASEDSMGLDFWDATAHGGSGDRELSRDVHWNSQCAFLYMEIIRQLDFLHVLPTEQGNQVESHSLLWSNSGYQVTSCLPRFVGFSKVIWPGKQDSRERK